MIRIDIRPELADVERMLREMSPTARRATSRAINRTLTTVRAEAARQVREQRNLPIREIRRQMRIDRATPAALSGSIVVTGRPIPIRHFARSSSRGVSAKVTRKGRAVLLRREGRKAFRNPAVGGGLPVLYRVSSKRLPIRAWPPVPGIPRVLVQDRIVAALRALAHTTFRSRIASELRFELSRVR